MSNSVGALCCSVASKRFSPNLRNRKGVFCHGHGTQAARAMVSADSVGTELLKGAPVCSGHTAPKDRLWAQAEPQSQLHSAVWLPRGGP